MKQILHQLKGHIIRASMVVFASLVLFLGVTSPAMAFGNSSSHPSEGTAQMNDLQEASEQSLKNEPRSRGEVQKKAQEGPNEIQGSADADKMYNQSNSRETTSVRKQVEKGLEKITPGN